MASISHGRGLYHKLATRGTNRVDINIKPTISRTAASTAGKPPASKLNSIKMHFSQPLKLSLPALLFASLSTSCEESSTHSYQTNSTSKPSIPESVMSSLMADISAVLTHDLSLTLTPTTHPRLPTTKSTSTTSTPALPSCILSPSERNSDSCLRSLAEMQNSATQTTTMTSLPTCTGLLLHPCVFIPKNSSTTLASSASASKTSSTTGGNGTVPGKTSSVVTTVKPSGSAVSVGLQSLGCRGVGVSWVLVFGLGLLGFVVVL